MATTVRSTEVMESLSGVHWDLTLSGFGAQHYRGQVLSELTLKRQEQWCNTLSPLVRQDSSSVMVLIYARICLFLTYPTPNINHG